MRTFAWLPWLRWGIAIAVLLAITTAIGVLAPRMSPVKPGRVETFWLGACGVKLPGGSTEDIPTVYSGRDGWFVYGYQDLHGEDLFKVREDDALKRFPEVVAQLDSGDYDKGMMLCREHTYRRWLQKSPSRMDARTLLEDMAAAGIAATRRRSFGSFEYVVRGNKGFDRRWQRIRRYPLTVVFEVVYLNALAMFLLWPWLRRLAPWRWALHVGAFPFLLMLPYYLGYAGFTFTTALSGGGVLYPRLIAPLCDHAFYMLFPKPLIALSQTPGPMLAISGHGRPPPTTVILLSMAIASVVFVIAKSLAWWRSRRPRRPAETSDTALTSPTSRPPVHSGTRPRRIRSLVVTLAVVCLILGTGVGLRVCEHRPPAVFAALDDRDLSAVKAALAADPDSVNAKVATGLTPVLFAAQYRDYKTLEYLIENGADIEATDEQGATALHYAAASYSERKVSLLLAMGLKPDLRDSFGDTPLHRAASEDRPEVVQFLIENGADVNARGVDQTTPLHRAWNARTTVVLIRLGADVAAQDVWGDTPLHKASSLGDRDCMQALLDAGAPVNAAAKDGITPLHMAAWGGWPETLQLLLDHGADVNARDSQGLRPFEHVRPGASPEGRMLLDPSRQRP